MAPFRAQIKGSSSSMRERETWWSPSRSYVFKSMECQGNPMEKLLIDFKLLRGAAHLNEPVKRFLLKNHDHYITTSLARSNMQDLFSVLECWIFASIDPKSSTDDLSLSVQASLLGYFMASQYCWWITNRALLVWLFLARPPSAVLSPRGFHKIYMNHHTQSVVRQQ